MHFVMHLARFHYHHHAIQDWEAARPLHLLGVPHHHTTPPTRALPRGSHSHSPRDTHPLGFSHRLAQR